LQKQPVCHHSARTKNSSGNRSLGGSQQTQIMVGKV
jgi:hypothetical protein